jgi:hypothetical protein
VLNILSNRKCSAIRELFPTAAKLPKIIAEDCSASVPDASAYVEPQREVQGRQSHLCPQNDI